MKPLYLARYLPGIAWFFIVLALICMPGKEFPSANWFNKIYLDKWVHAGIFGLLALLFMLPAAISPMENHKKLQSFIWIAIITSLWGLGTEFIQKYWVTGRNFDLLDWAADSVGALTSLLLCKKKFI